MPARSRRELPVHLPEIHPPTAAVDQASRLAHSASAPIAARSAISRPTKSAFLTRMIPFTPTLISSLRSSMRLRHPPFPLGSPRHRLARPCLPPLRLPQLQDLQEAMDDDAWHLPSKAFSKSPPPLGPALVLVPILAPPLAPPPGTPVRGRKQAQHPAATAWDLPPLPLHTLRARRQNKPKLTSEPPHRPNRLCPLLNGTMKPEDRVSDSAFAMGAPPAL